MTEQNENFLQIFDEQWQRAIVGFLFTDTLMYYRCKDYIQPEWFTNPNTAEICKRLFEFVKYTNKLPGKPENLYNTIIVKAYPNDQQRLSKFRAEAINCVDATKTVDKAHLTEMMTMWMKVSMFQNTISKSVKTFNQHQYTQAIKEMKEGIDSLNNASFMEDGRVDFSDGATGFFLKNNQEAKMCASIGHPEFDYILNTNDVFERTDNTETIHQFSSTGKRSIEQLNQQIKGGLRRGDSTIIIGPPNAGKTTTLCSVVATNVLMGKKVLFITHEMAWEDVKTKIYASISGYNLAELSSMHLKGKEHIKEAVALMETYLQENLVYIPWVKIGHMSAEKVISLIREKQEELKATNNGKGFDLVIDDYPGKLRSDDFANKKADIWDERRYVYSLFMICAQEERFHGIWPIQSNREGFRINRGDGKRVLDMSDVAESFGVMMDADNVITINRSPNDEKENLIRYHIAKCRGGTKGHIFQSSTNMSISRTFHISLPSMVYHSSSPPSAETTNTIKDFNPKEKKDEKTDIKKGEPFINNQLTEAAQNDFNIGNKKNEEKS